MSIPILLVYSFEGDAREIGETVLNNVSEVIHRLNIKWNIEIVKRSSKIFVVSSTFKPLDYKFKEDCCQLEWGLDPAVSNVKMEFKDSDLTIYIPDTPYYSSSLYIWRDKNYIVASPWWLPPSIAATLFHELLIDSIYVWSVVSWSYSISHRALHPSVYRVPTGSMVKMGPSESIITTIFKYDTIYKADLSKLVNLLLEGAKNFLYVLEEQGINEVWVGLSGGLDSRTTLSSLVKASENRDIKVKAYTDIMPWTDPREVEIARSIAEALDVEHRIIDNKNPDPYKAFNAISNPFKDNKMVIANGTGGDKTLDPLGRIKWSPSRDLNNMALKIIKTIDYSVDLPPIHRYTKGIYRALIENLVNGVSNSLELYRRYIIEFRLMNWLTSFTHPYISPFLYPRFFKEAFRIDPVEKNYFILYAKVLNKLDDRLLKIPYYNLGIRLSPEGQIQKIKCISKYIWTGFKKVLRGQRGSIVLTKLAWEYVERLYSELNKIYNPIGDQTYKILEEALKSAIESRPKSARALKVARNIIRVLKELTALNIANNLRRVS